MDARLSSSLFWRKYYGLKTVVCACLFACLLAVTWLQCMWDHTKTVILTGLRVCVLVCLLVCLLWLHSSVSEIAQKQWFSEITQKQWFLTGLSVCLLVLVCLLWLKSSVSVIIEKQWFFAIAQTTVILTGLSVCLLACLFACRWMCLTRRHATYSELGFFHIWLKRWCRETKTLPPYILTTS